MTPAVRPVDGRACDSCSLCCWLPEIDAFDKPANQVCGHCRLGAGCSIYSARPATCRDFYCTWISDARMPDIWRPARCHMMVYAQGPQVTVLVEPDYPQAWCQEPYFSQLRQWAFDLEQSHGYVIVYVGDTPIKIDPHDGQIAGDNLWSMVG